MRGPRFWESFSPQIEKIIRETLENEETISNLRIEKGQTVRAEDLRALRNELLNCITTQRAILYMLYMMSEAMSEPDEKPLPSQSMK